MTASEGTIKTGKDLKGNLCFSFEIQKDYQNHPKFKGVYSTNQEILMSTNQ